jgi:HD-GYP domain-containing protein (c-di-GMP phosphodiesterase class II)
MREDYREDLERAARQMILVRDVDILSKLITRTILKKVGVSHAGLFLCDKKKGEYIIKVSGGDDGVKIPAGFTKVAKTNPLIRYFVDPVFRAFKQDYLLFDRLTEYMVSVNVVHNGETVHFVEELLEEMSLYEARALIPGFYRDDLIAVFFLGEKNDKSVFAPEELSFLSVLASDVVMAIQNAWFFEDLNDQLLANKRLFLNTVTAMATAIEAKDKYTIGHTERVVKYSMLISRFMKDDRITDDFRDNLKVSALLHDIGKIGIPEKVLNKEGPLDETERKCISTHPDIGAGILSHISEFNDIILGVRFHHERYDGKGYPSQLCGDGIPLPAAIIAVADTFDAMTSNRPYRKALSDDEAINEIKLNSGKQFHPDVVAAFVKGMQEEKRQDVCTVQPSVQPAVEQPKADYCGQTPPPL